MVTKNKIAPHAAILIASILISILITSLIFYQFKRIESLFRLDKTKSAILFGIFLALALLIILEIGKYIIFRKGKIKLLKYERENVVPSGSIELDALHNPITFKKKISSTPSSVIGNNELNKSLNESTNDLLQSNKPDNNFLTSSIRSMTNNSEITSEITNNHPGLPISSDNQNVEEDIPDGYGDAIKKQCIRDNIIFHYLMKERAETELAKVKSTIESLKINQQFGSFFRRGIDLVWIDGEKYFYLCSEREKDSISGRTYYNFNNPTICMVNTGDRAITYYNENSTVYKTNDANSFILETIDINGRKTYRWINYDCKTRKVSEIKEEGFEEVDSNNVTSHNDAQKADDRAKDPLYRKSVPTILPVVENAYRAYHNVAPRIQQASNIMNVALTEAMGFVSNLTTSIPNSFTPNNPTQSRVSTQCGFYRNQQQSSQSTPMQNIQRMTQELIDSDNNQIMELLPPKQEEIALTQDVNNTLKILVLYEDLEEKLGITTQQANLIREEKQNHNPGVYKLWVDGTPCFRHSYSNQIYKLEDCITQITSTAGKKITYYDSNSTVCVWNLIGDNEQRQAIGTVILKSYENDDRISHQMVFYNLDENRIIQLTKGEYKAIRHKYKEEVGEEQYNKENIEGFNLIDYTSLLNILKEISNNNFIPNQILSATSVNNPDDEMVYPPRANSSGIRKS